MGWLFSDKASPGGQNRYRQSTAGGPYPHILISLTRLGLTSECPRNFYTFPFSSNVFHFISGAGR